MKKVVKLISLFGLLLMINALRVEADIKANSYSDAGYFGGEKVLEAKLNVNGTNTTAYCHNPGVTAFTQSDVSNKITLVTKRKLGDTKNGRAQNIYDAGLMSILTNNNKDNGNANFSMAKYIAVNLYEQLFPMFNTNGNNGSSEIPYLKYIVNTQLYDSVKSDLKTLSNNMGAYNVISSRMSGASKCTSNCGSSSDVNTAVSMVKTALKTAINYAQNGEATATVGNAIQTRSETKDDKGKVTYKDTANHTITIASFGDSNNRPRSVYLSFNCANCKNVTTKFYLNDKEVNDISKINLLDYTDNGSGAVQLKIEFTGDTCEEINYTLTATYTHYSISRSGYSVAKCSNSNKCQGFYVADSSSSTGTKTTSIENKISLCPTNADVSQCTAKIDNVECVECKANTHEVNIVEGYTYPNDNTCDTSGATLDIKKCIANDGAIDTANHTYKNSELSQDTKSHNAGVYCKEDYTLSMPGSIMVDTGRYFTLKSSITGTEKCYTNDLLNSKSVASVKARITQLGNETVDAYNQIQKNKAIAACLKDNSLCNFEKTYTSKECRRSAELGPVSLETFLRLQKLAPGSQAADDKYRVEVRSAGYYVDGNGNQVTYDSSCSNESGTHIGCKGANGQCVSCSWKSQIYYKLAWYEYTPVIKMSGTYNTKSKTCGSSTASFSETFTGSPLGCGTKQNADGDFTGLIEDDYAALIAQIGEASTYTSVSSGGVPGKVPSSSYQIGKAGSGLMVHLGSGSINAELESWNSATGYYGGIFGNDFDDTPFDGGWKMSYNFDPDMYFWYQEEYMKQARTNQMDMYDKSLKDVKAQYCEGTVSNDYQTCSTGWKDIPSVESGSVCVCWGPDPGDCGNKNYVLSKVRYVIQSQEAEAKFITPTQFYTIAPSGSIVVADQGKSDEIPNSKELTNGLPVGLGSNGTRRYVLWVEKLGEYFDTDNLGRVWGQSDSVISKLLKDRTKCNNPNSALVDEDNTQGVIHDEGVYACKYSTDCPKSCTKEDDKYYCKDGEPCDEEQYDKECCPTCPPTVAYKCAVTTNEKGETVYYDKAGNITTEKIYKSECCPNDECPVTCAFCLYDGNKLNVQYRPITSENVNPNDRDLGKNWSWEEPINTALELKAYVTTNEIEENGDSIYDVNFDNIDENNDFAMQVTMNAQMISEIRAYNDKYKDEGYANNSLECYDLKSGDTVHKNVFCYSNFIDTLVEKFATNKDDSPIKFNVERPMGNARKDTKENEKYFTSWISADTSNWNVTTTKELAYYKQHYGMEMQDDKVVDYHVGPSWK